MNATHEPRSDFAGSSIEPLPAALGSPRSKLIYLYLTVTGEATAADLRSTLGITSLSLFPTLTMLRDVGVIEQSGTVYRVAD